jgi:hypothetical protein
MLDTAFAVSLLSGAITFGAEGIRACALQRNAAHTDKLVYCFGIGLSERLDERMPLF